MSKQRIIKKYPNRRLYDTEISRYITLMDVRELVMKAVPFRVVDTVNDEDLTRTILLQIMLEEESGGEPLFSAAMLSQIIRFYGGTLHGVFAHYMKHSLDSFAEHQKQLVETWGEVPLDALGRVTQRNLEILADAHKNFMRAMGFKLSDGDSTTAEIVPSNEQPASDQPGKDEPG
ncbi:MAG TPA: polyhydroxyalkanoate synthesis repressor PhaR [Chromatiaceae bacterium]|jgi:polyhydroxyalkanoate synthesis repressor PhaR|nr:MAG: polyhydroxyalkanoate synthesis repressor PhaR [Thiohalocapsa sp. PB-PSB1]HBG95157.1 polyhydroxyalkanoate synthesis repressor PhaR [Chromatiaceae bacterium]